MKAALVYRVEPGYLKAMSIPLKQGRFFTNQDDERSQPVVVIDEVLAHKYFGDTNPIGRRIHHDGQEAEEIVGVVGHAAHEGLDAEPRIQYYFPASQSGMRFMNLAVRTTGNPTTVLAAAREAVHSVDRDLPISTVNITGFLTISRGLSFTKDCLIAELTSAGSNNFI